MDDDPETAAKSAAKIPDPTEMTDHHPPDETASNRRTTSRRALLAGIGAAGIGGLAGCTGFQLQSSGNNEPPLLENRPDAVYFPTHTEGMKMVGMTDDGAYRCGLMFTWPHRFWTVTGQNLNRVELQDADSVHLMVAVWHAESGQVIPDVNPKLTLRRDGNEVTSLNPWPMLSQPMGYHFGDNVQLPEEGEYRVAVEVGEPSSRRFGSLEDAGSAGFEFSFDYQRSTLQELRFTDIPDAKEGTKGAVPPMEMQMLPSTRAPKPEALPGELGGAGTSGDADVAITVVDDATPYGGGEDESYLAVSPRTPYNRYMLPLMSLSASLTSEGETVFDDHLHAATGTDLGIHYGTVVSDAEEGDEVTVTVDAPPQVSRHEGYETAFVEMPDVAVTL